MAKTIQRFSLSASISRSLEVLLCCRACKRETLLLTLKDSSGRVLSLCPDCLGCYFFGLHIPSPYLPSACRGLAGKMAETCLLNTSGRTADGSTRERSNLTDQRMHTRETRLKGTQSLECSANVSYQNFLGQKQIP